MGCGASSQPPTSVLPITVDGSQARSSDKSAAALGAALSSVRATATTTSMAFEEDLNLPSEAETPLDMRARAVLDDEVLYKVLVVDNDEERGDNFAYWLTHLDLKYDVKVVPDAEGALGEIRKLREEELGAIFASGVADAEDANKLDVIAEDREMKSKRKERARRFSAREESFMEAEQLRPFDLVVCNVRPEESWKTAKKLIAEDKRKKKAPKDKKDKKGKKDKGNDDEPDQDADVELLRWIARHAMGSTLEHNMSVPVLMVCAPTEVDLAVAQGAVDVVYSTPKVRKQLFNRKVSSLIAAKRLGDSRLAFDYLLVRKDERLREAKEMTRKWYQNYVRERRYWKKRVHHLTKSKQRRGGGGDSNAD